MGLYAQLGPTLREQYEDHLYAAFSNRLAAEERRCSFYKLFPVRAALFSKVGCGLYAEFVNCRTRAEIAAAGVTLTSRFLDFSRRQTALVITSAAYRQKLAGWPLLDRVTCPARGDDLQGFPGTPFLPNGPAAVGVDGRGRAGAFEVQESLSSSKFFFLTQEQGTGDVQMHLSFDFRVRTVV